MQRDRLILAIGVPLAQALTVEVERLEELDPLTGQIVESLEVYYNIGTQSVQRPRHDWLQIGSEFYGILKQHGLELITPHDRKFNATEWEENRYICSAIVGKRCSAVMTMDELSEVLAQVLDVLGSLQVEGEVVVRAMSVRED